MPLTLTASRGTSSWVRTVPRPAAPAIASPQSAHRQRRRPVPARATANDPAATSPTSTSALTASTW